MENLILKNAKVILDNKFFDGDVLVKDGIIEKIEKNIESSGAEKVINLSGKYLAPGFIDIHIHGSNGADAMDGTKDALKTISSFVVTKGVTNFLATTLTSSKEELINVLKNVAELQDKELDGADIFGVHMEGPYFDTEYKGAQDDRFMKPITVKELSEYINVKKGLVKMMSLSPKDDSSLECIKYLKDNGVVASVGHSAVKFEDVERAVRYGLSHSTHTYNGMRGFNHREPGVVGAVFAIDEINAEIIFDGIHVHPESVRVLIKVKGVDKVICITDAMSATALPDGDYKLGKLDVYVKDFQARLKSNDSLAGSVLTMDKAFRNILSLGYTVFDAVKMTSTNAAKEFKLNAGEIKVGKQGDFVVLDENFEVKSTIVKGKIKF